MNANTISKTLGKNHTRSTRTAGMIRGAGRRTPGFIVTAIPSGKVRVECYGPNNGTTEHAAKLNEYRTTLESAGYAVYAVHGYFTGLVDAIVVIGTATK